MHLRCIENSPCVMYIRFMFVPKLQQTVLAFEDVPSTRPLIALSKGRYSSMSRQGRNVYRVKLTGLSDAARSGACHHPSCVRTPSSLP
jgi:hypothetical protein